MKSKEKLKKEKEKLKDLLDSLEGEPFGKFLVRLEKYSLTLHTEVLEAVGTVGDDMVLTKEQRKRAEEIIEARLDKLKEEKKELKEIRKMSFREKLRLLFSR